MSLILRQVFGPSINGLYLNVNIELKISD